MAHRLAWQMVSIFGSKVIPGAKLRWAPPIEPMAWNELCEDWRRHLNWGEAAWGPPGADEVLYRVSATALRFGHLPRPEAAEAIRFWEDRLSRRTALDERDRRLRNSVLAALRRLGR